MEVVYYVFGRYIFCQVIFGYGVVVVIVNGIVKMLVVVFIGCGDFFFLGCGGGVKMCFEFNIWVMGCNIVEQVVDVFWVGYVNSI